MLDRNIVLVGAAIALGAPVLGYAVFKAGDVTLNLIAEVFGIALGAIVLVALLNWHQRRTWKPALDSMLRLLYWELELLHLRISDVPEWNVGNSLSQDLDKLVRQAPTDELSMDYFRALAAKLCELDVGLIGRSVPLLQNEKLAEAVLVLEGAVAVLRLNMQSAPVAEQTNALQRLSINAVIAAAAKAACEIEKELYRSSPAAQNSRRRRLQEVHGLFPIHQSGSAAQAPLDVRRTVGGG